MAAFIPSALATAFSAIGALSSASAERRASNYNAAVADRNAGIARQQAAADAQLHDQRVRRHLGTMRTQIAKSGVMLEGSPLDVLEQSAAEAEMDKMNILYKGELTALGYQDTAALNKSRAADATTSGLFGAGKAVLLHGQPAAQLRGVDEEIVGYSRRSLKRTN